MSDELNQTFLRIKKMGIEASSFADDNQQGPTTSLIQANTYQLTKISPLGIQILANTSIFLTNATQILRYNLASRELEKVSSPGFASADLLYDNSKFILSCCTGAFCLYNVFTHKSIEYQSREYSHNLIGSTRNYIFVVCGRDQSSLDVFSRATGELVIKSNTLFLGAKIDRIVGFENKLYARVFNQFKIFEIETLHHDPNLKRPAFLSLIHI